MTGTMAMYGHPYGNSTLYTFRQPPMRGTKTYTSHHTLVVKYKKRLHILQVKWRYISLHNRSIKSKHKDLHTTQVY